MTHIFSETYFVLILMIALGIILGHIKIRGISLDNSGVLFVALLLGHFGFTIPDEFQKIGLVLFIYTVGMQAGPGFFESFRAQGRQLLASTAVLIVSATTLTVLFSLLFDLNFDLALGLLTGALTSTPGLAAAIEASNSPLASIGYGIAYPFGVVGVILFVRMLPELFNIDLDTARKAYQTERQADYPALRGQNFKVTNENVFNKTLRELRIAEMTGATVSRIKQYGHAFTPIPETMLQPGDIIRAIGTEESLEKMKLLIGEPTVEEIPLSKEFDVQLVLVTNESVVNKTLAELNLPELYNANVTRIRRSGVDITPQPHRQIRFGDRLMIICAKENMKDVIALLGNETKRLSETDFLPIALGIVAGVLLGQIPIPLPGGTTFRLGITGGVLGVALVLSRVGKTGPIIWSLPGSANHLLRQLGLLFFLAAVGSQAGSHLAEIFAQYGARLFLMGVFITLVPMLIMTLIAYFVYKMNFVVLLGVLTGAMTSTPGLAAVDSMTESNAPQVSYATVYPIALVLIIFVSQIIGRI